MYEYEFLKSAERKIVFHSYTDPNALYFNSLLSNVFKNVLFLQELLLL